MIPNHEVGHVKYLNHMNMLNEQIRWRIANTYRIYKLGPLEAV